MTDRLPALLVGRRRRLFAALLATGVGQAALAGLTVMLMPVLLTATTPAQRVAGVVGLGAGALLLGVMRLLERVLAERLSQDYVHQIRKGLVASSLVQRGPSVGITVARTTNDLTAVRNWIALGITPLAVGVPVLAGSLVALATLHPLLAWAVGVPMLLLSVTLLLLSRLGFSRARTVRRRRGALAAHLSDMVMAAESIRSAGGLHRELKHIDKVGGAVISAAVARAQVSGYIRGAAASAASLAVVAVAAVGSWYDLGGATIATALTVVGVLAGPVGDLGRVVEYRQSYRAAARIIGPALTPGLQTMEHDRRLAQQDAPHVASPVRPGAVRVIGLVVGNHPVPDLTAQPGERVVLRSADPRRVQAVVRALAGIDTAFEGSVWVAGHFLHDTPAARRRELVGVAARGQAIERGTVARAVRYRNPESDDSISSVLDMVGLREAVDRLPEGERTKLRRGGEPLSLPERAQLLLARAVYAAPPLVVLDHIDAQLGVSGRAALRRCLTEQPGVVVATTDDPDAFLDDHRVWDLDRATRTAVPPLRLVR